MAELKVLSPHLLVKTVKSWKLQQNSQCVNQVLNPRLPGCDSEHYILKHMFSTLESAEFFTTKIRYTNKCNCISDCHTVFSSTILRECSTIFSLWWHVTTQPQTNLVYLVFGDRFQDLQRLHYCLQFVVNNFQYIQRWFYCLHFVVRSSRISRDCSVSSVCRKKKQVPGAYSSAFILWH
jgi:hypothetical protein